VSAGDFCNLLRRFAHRDLDKVMVNELLMLIGGSAGTRKGHQAKAVSGQTREASARRGREAAAAAKQAPAPKAAARQRPDPKQIIPLGTEEFRDF